MEPVSWGQPEDDPAVSPHPAPAYLVARRGVQSWIPGEDSNLHRQVQSL